MAMVSAEPPTNHDQWTTATEANMAKARNLAKDVLDRIRANEAADAANKKALDDGAKKEKLRARAKVQNKVKAHSQVINGSQKQMKEIEEALVQAEGIQTRLTHERYARYACFKVCERRLELRKARPQKEAFNDATQEALKKEWQALNQAREELLAGEAECSKVHNELARLRIQLSRDTGARRLAMHHELTSLKPSVGSSITTPMETPSHTRSASTTLPPIGPQTTTATTAAAAAAAEQDDSGNNNNNNSTLHPTGEGEGEEGGQQHDTHSSAEGTAHERHPHAQMGPMNSGSMRSNIARAAQLVQSVYDMKMRNDNLIVKIRQETNAFTKRVNEALSKRTKELAQMKKNFEFHVADVEHARSKAERALRTEEERLDPAGGDAEQQERVAALRAALADLVHSKASLQEDLRNKIAALDIDNSCKRCTPQMACEPQKPPMHSHSASNLHAAARETRGQTLFLPASSAPLSTEAPGGSPNPHSNQPGKAQPAATGSPPPRAMSKVGSSSALRAGAGLVLPPTVST